MRIWAVLFDRSRHEGGPRLLAPFALLLAAVIDLCGCGGSAPHMRAATPGPIVPDPAAATLVFLRPPPSQLDGIDPVRLGRTAEARALTALVVTDRFQFLGESEAGSYFTSKLPPGDHFIVAWRYQGLVAPPGVVATMQATVAAGKIYFIRITPQEVRESPEPGDSPWSAWELFPMGPSRDLWSYLPSWLSGSRALSPKENAERSVAADEPRAREECGRAAQQFYSSPAARALHTLRINDGVSEAPTAATARALAHAMFVGHTLLYYDDSRGNQIEYYDPDGRAFLWRSGDGGSVSGNWRRDKDGLEEGFCVRYPADTYNPVTGRRDGEWSCFPLRSLGAAAIDVAAGDVFTLGTGSTPFLLPAQPPFGTISQVKAAHR